MKKRFFAKILILTLLCFLSLELAACQQKHAAPPQKQVPTSSQLFNQIVQQKPKSCQSHWQQTNGSGKVLQAVQVKYQRQPLVVYANFMTRANHFRMWISGKTNYIQMQGTASKHWFKTKLAKSSAYAQITDDLVPVISQTFGQQAKLFHVRSVGNNYELVYHGRSQKIWRSLCDNALIASVIGVDLDHVKPADSTIIFQTNRHSHLRQIRLQCSYRDEGHDKQLRLRVDHLNQGQRLAIPRFILHSAVNLGR